MPPCCGAVLSLDARKRHMGPEWPLVYLAEGLKQRALQCLDLGTCRAFGPDQPRVAALRPVAQTLEGEGKALKSGKRFAQLFDGGWNRGLMPRRDEGEVDVALRHAPEENAVDPLR